MADYYQLRHWLTSGFYQHHVIQVRVHSAAELLTGSKKDAKTLDELAKKAAEMLFQERYESGRIPINSVLVVGQQEAANLIGELQARQGEFTRDWEREQQARRPAAAPAVRPRREVRNIYTSRRPYPYYERGGPQPKDRQRARFVGLGLLRYAVREELGEFPDRFKVCHLEPLVPAAQ